MNQKVNLSIKEIKRLAKQMYAGRFSKCLFVVLGCKIVAMAPEYLCYMFVKSDLIYNIAYAVSFILNVVLTFACYGFCLKISRGENPGLDDIVDSFSLTGQSVVLEILSNIGTFLRAILLVVPGIVYAFKIGFAKFSLTDNPAQGVKQALNRSKNLMQGNLSKFFTLQLSYIGIYILCALPKSIYTAFKGPDLSSFVIYPEMSVEAMQTVFYDYVNAVSIFNSTPIAVALDFVSIIALTYIILCNACFYDLAAGNIIIENHDDATDIQY